MHCTCCGRVWIGLADCYFCVWWGSTLLAGVSAEVIDPIIRKEMKRYAFALQKGKSGYYTVHTEDSRAGSEGASGGARDLPHPARAFGLDF